MFWQQGIAPAVDTLRLTTTGAGQVRQDDSTSSMIVGVRELVVAASQTFTLLPGDVILTGTPAGVAPIHPGDRVDITIEGIGTLSNPVVRR